VKEEQLNNQYFLFGKNLTGVATAQGNPTTKHLTRILLVLDPRSFARRNGFLIPRHRSAIIATVDMMFTPEQT